MFMARRKLLGRTLTQVTSRCVPSSFRGNDKQTHHLYNVPMQFFTTNFLPIGFVLLSIATLVLLGLIIHMYLKMKRFLVGINSDHIGDSLSHVSNELVDLKKFRTELEIYIAELEKRVRKSVQSVHTVRFNPFKGTGGGNQSFSTAFLNEEGDGVIISSLYSREHVSIFSKPVKKHGSEYELSDEEEESLKEAGKILK